MAWLDLTAADCTVSVSASVSSGSEVTSYRKDPSGGLLGSSGSNRWVRVWKPSELTADCTVTVSISVRFLRAVTLRRVCLNFGRDALSSDGTPRNLQDVGPLFHVWGYRGSEMAVPTCSVYPGGWSPGQPAERLSYGKHAYTFMEFISLEPQVMNIWHYWGLGLFPKLRSYAAGDTLTLTVDVSCFYPADGGASLIRTAIEGLSLAERPDFRSLSSMRFRAGGKTWQPFLDRAVPGGHYPLHCRGAGGEDETLMLVSPSDPLATPMRVRLDGTPWYVANQCDSSGALAVAGCPYGERAFTVKLRFRRTRSLITASDYQYRNEITYVGLSVPVDCPIRVTVSCIKEYSSAAADITSGTYTLAENSLSASGSLASASYPNAEYMRIRVSACGSSTCVLHTHIFQGYFGTETAAGPWEVKFNLAQVGVL